MPFLAYFEELHVPAISPGDIVLIDNLGSHSLKISEAIEVMGAERTVEALAASYAFKRRVQQISDQCCNQASNADHDK
jgi:hypothetical protein